MLFSERGKRTFCCGRLLLVSAFLGSSPVLAFTLQGTDSNIKGWSQSSLSIQVNYTDCTVSHDTLNQAIDDAFSLWNSVSTSGLKLVRGNETSASVTDYFSETSTAISNGPVIFCSSQFSTLTSKSGDSIIGLGYAAASDGQINFGFLVLNAEQGKAAEMSKVSSTQLSIVIAHEIGHVLGLGHSQDTNALMYYDLTTKAKLKLASDDVDGITYLYPRNEISTPYPLGCGTIDNQNRSNGKYHDSSGRKVPGSSFWAFFNLLALFGFAYFFTRSKIQKIFQLI